MRLLKRARERQTITISANNKNSRSDSLIASMQLQQQQQQQQKLTQSQMRINQNNQAHNEAILIDHFFDLEAELEKYSICRDDITYNSNEKQNEFIHELSEIVCYSLMTTPSFNCLLFRYLIREIFSNHLLKHLIDTISDPHYINQTIIYMTRGHSPSIENFLVTLNSCQNIIELNELNLKLDEEIATTRSFDKGGENDQMIKLKLSSLFYVKKQIDARIVFIMQQSNYSTPPQPQPQQQQQQQQQQGGSNVNNNSENEYRMYLFNQFLASMDFSIVLSNEPIQLCFIEYMGTKSVQNLISFYLNADIYRQFAKKELKKLTNSLITIETDIVEVKMALKEFSKGLISTYLLSAENFNTSNDDDGDDEPVNISNHLFYKSQLVRTMENIENLDKINEFVLDELQSKIETLMKDKYFNGFKEYSEFRKILLKNDLFLKLTPPNSTIIDDVDDIGDNNDIDIDDNISVSSLDADRLSQTSLDSTNPMNGRIDYSSLDSSSTTSSSQMNIPFKLSATIISAGRCKDLKSVYAIYIIEVIKKNNISTIENQMNDTNNTERWQTYRRFNDFQDLHNVIKKRFPKLKKFMLPGRSFRTSLNDEFLERRSVELNRYLQTLCNSEVQAANPDLIPIVNKFLENKIWQTSQTKFKRRVDSFLTPVLSSVQNIQTSIKNAPENMIGIVKDTVDVFSNSTTTTSAQPTKQPPIISDLQRARNNKSMMNLASQLQPLYNNTNNHQLPPTPTSLSASSTSINTNNNQYISPTNIDQIQISSNILLVRLLLIIIDEIFDLKEKNQWFRQSLLAIVKSFMKNFKRDSMHRKFKEQIADFLNEEYIARYLKNFRKRIWPKNQLAEAAQPPTNSVIEITKVMAKTKLLSLISDDLRHLLGNDTTRRGVFNLFDLFQHTPLNKRLVYIFTESFLLNFFGSAGSNLNNFLFDNNNSIEQIMTPNDPIDSRNE
jgi:sorting nexin-13